LAVKRALIARPPPIRADGSTLCVRQPGGQKRESTNELYLVLRCFGLFLDADAFLLARTFLAGAFLAGAFLAGALLAGAFLAGAFLAGAFLAEAWLGLGWGLVGWAFLGGASWLGPLGWGLLAGSAAPAQ
jgi:hypothetical protein